MEVAKDTKPGGVAEGAHVHVVHLTDAEDSLDHVKVRVILALLSGQLCFEHEVFDTVNAIHE